MQKKKKLHPAVVLLWMFILLGFVAGDIDISIIGIEFTTMGVLIFGLIAVGAFVLLTGLRIVNQYERGVILTLGKYRGIRAPGLTWIFWPFNIQRMLKVDLRVKAVDVPDQKAITKDNISVNVNAVVYYKVKDANKAILEVEDFFHAMSQLAQTTMRDVVGEVDLDELLAARDKISERIRQIVDEVSDPWGIAVDAVSLKDVALPENMERTIAKQAEAEREKRAVIIKAEGEVASAENMRAAAEILGSTPGALHLRTLQSINDISSDQSNTIVFALPLEVLKGFEKLAGK